MACDKFLPKPPESMRPDRPERMVCAGSGVLVPVNEGVVFESLVGSHNNARNLTTGIVTVGAHAHLPYHWHSFSEGVTLLSGEVAIEIQGRRYTLQFLDNVVIPAGIAHAVTNESNNPATLHIAMATSSPARSLVTSPFPVRHMANDVSGFQGAEAVTRFKLAKQFEAAPHATFVDYFNGSLVRNLEMSGGYGFFQSGGRLPAHVHDFDESISIIEGSATCVVEGRRYTLSNYATALQPRGRVHYFMNEGSDPMAMIWVYANPKPTRLVVDERCATDKGYAWS